MPVYVLVGNGSGDCILQLPKEPNVGDTIDINRWAIIVGTRSAKPPIKVGSYLVTKRTEGVNSGIKKYGKLPLVSLSGPLQAKHNPNHD
jgi:hypothetical protein